MLIHGCVNSESDSEACDQKGAQNVRDSLCAVGRESEVETSATVRHFVFRSISRGMIALNRSATYVIEPLANHSISQGHAVFRAESLKIPMSTCSQHHGGENQTDKLAELIGGIAQASHSSRVNICQISNYQRFRKLDLYLCH